jgi:Ni,Fe-hydrogenase III component G
MVVHSTECREKFLFRKDPAKETNGISLQSIPSVPGLRDSAQRFQREIADENWLSGYCTASCQERRLFRKDTFRSGFFASSRKAFDP